MNNNLRKVYNKNIMESDHRRWKKASRKLSLPNVTLIGVDCVDVERLGKAAAICNGFVKFGVVKLLSSIKSNVFSTILIKPLTLESYSKFMIRNLNSYIKTDYALTFQYDGFVLNPDVWTDEFFHYDYIGAPWWYDDGRNVGNGGFSLRSKKLLKILANDPHIRKFIPEDHHICRTYRKYLESKGIKFAPEYLASRFSIEGNIHQLKNGQNIWRGQFGFHDLKKTILKTWIKDHPKYNFIDNTLKESYRIKKKRKTLKRSK
jgi:hypothetical protein